MATLTLVTGAAGFAGSHLIDLLHSESADLVGWHRPDSGAPPVDGVRWRPVDIELPDQVMAAIAADRPARVYHCAGAAHVGQAWDQTTKALAANVRGTHHLLDALRVHAPDARVLIPSSGLVYAPSTEALTEDAVLRPANPYGVSKLAQEMIGIGAIGGPRVWIARPFNHFGPRQASTFVSAGFARQIAEIEAGQRAAEISVGNLDARRDLTDVRDTVRAYTRILEDGRPEHPYNVCAGQAIQIQHILDLLLQRSRVPIRVVVDPTRYRPNDTPVVLGNGGRIQRELAWRPLVPLETTLDDLLEYWRERTTRS